MTEPCNIETYSLGQLDTNCHIVWCPETLEAIIIDPADEGGFITEEITRLQLIPLCIVFTHGHFDHVLGSLELKLNFDIPIFMHPEDSELLSKAQESAKYWLKTNDVPPVPLQTQPISEEVELKFGNYSLRVIETPGHTKGSICLYMAEPEPILFTGDTLFKNGVGRTDFAYSSPRKLYASLEKLFTTLPEGTECYTGHGEMTFLASEQ